MTVKTYVLECGAGCSFGPKTKWGPQVTEWLLDGWTYQRVIDEVKARTGDVLWAGTMSRHRKHIVVTGTVADAEKPQQDRYKANNIEILETIIQKGFQNQKNWKPTISDTMKAMDMWFRLTQGNPFDQLLDTLASAAIGEDVPEETNERAVHAVGEAQMPIFEDEDEGELVESAR